MQAVLLGPPGAGKGTQAELLCQARALLHLSTGDLLRAAVAAGTDLGVEAKGYMDRGELVPDSLVLALLEERLGKRAADEGFLLDGFPRNVSQAEALQSRIGADAIDHVVYLKLEDDEILRRLLQRGRKDDTEEVILNRLSVYRAETEPLVAYFRDRGLIRDVDALGTVEEVHQRLLDSMTAGDAASC